MAYDGTGFPLTDAVADAGDPPADFNKAIAAIRDLQSAGLALMSDVSASSGGARGPVIVASFDAPPSVQGAADYVCDGTDDDVQINSALLDAARPSDGGSGRGGVLLAGATFQVGQAGGSIKMRAATILAGLGPGTMIVPLYAAYSATVGAIMLNDGSVDHCQVRDLTIARPLATTSKCNGIYFDQGTASGSAKDLQTGSDAFLNISNVFVNKMQGRGIYTANSREAQVRDVMVWDCAAEGIYLSSSDSRIYDSTVTGQSANGIVTAGGNAIVQGCKVYYVDGSADGFVFQSSRVMAMNNSAQDCGRWGFNVTSSNATVVGAICDSNARTDATGGGINIASSGVYEGIHCFDRGQTPASPQLVGINIAGAYSDLVLTGRVSVPSGSSYLTGSTPAAGSFVRVARVGSTLYSVG